MDFDGLARRARAHPSRRAAAGRARHARAVAVRARDPQRAAVRVPGRCAARGAADARGADAARRRTVIGRRSRRARRRRDRAGARRGAAGSARRRRAARRAADRRVPDARTTIRTSRRELLDRRSPSSDGASARSQRRDRRTRRSWMSPPSGCPSCCAIHPARSLEPADRAPPSRAARAWTREERIVELLRGRLAIARPDRPRRRWPTSLGIVRGRRRRGAAGARSRGRRPARPLHAERERERRRMVRPRAARAHPSLHAEPAARGDRAGQPGRLHALPVRAGSTSTGPIALTGLDGLRAVIAQLDGFELAAARVGARGAAGARRPATSRRMLDMLCLTGEVGWARLSGPAADADGAVPGSCPRRRSRCSCASTPTPGRRLLQRRRRDEAAAQPELRARVLDVLRARGASFFNDSRRRCGTRRRRSCVRPSASSSRAACAASDGFAGLRALIWAARGRPAPARSSHELRRTLVGASHDRHGADSRERRRSRRRRGRCLRRYGVVFRRLLTREANAAPWRELTRVYRRLEARGEIRGGRFVSGMSGEQFALPEAVERLREVRRMPPDGRLLSSAPPTRSTSPASSRPATVSAPRAAIGWSTATACRWP